jgi:hypothetical protein
VGIMISESHGPEGQLGELIVGTARSKPERKSNRDAKGEVPPPARLRCAIYTRKSTEEGLDQEFNSLNAQREAAEAFIQSQRREGWIALRDLLQGTRGVVLQKFSTPLL